MPVTALINGVNYSWSNIKLVLFGTPVSGILKIDYKRKQAKTNNYGAGPKAVSRGYGREECEGSIELYTDDWRDIVSAAPNKNPLQIPPFNIQILYSGQGVKTNQDNLLQCEFMEDPFDAKEGDTKLTVNIPLIIGDIQKL
jgi:hypothetical protein